MTSSLLRAMVLASVTCATAADSSAQGMERSGQGSTLELVAQIGSDFGEGPYAFGDVRDVAVAPDGTILVLDAMAAEVRFFGPQGRFIRSVGGQGGGPGEFAYPMSLIDDGQGFLVTDPQMSRQTRFSWSGELRGTEALMSRLGHRLTLSLELAYGHTLTRTMATWGSTSALASASPEMILIVDPDWNRVDTLASYDAGAMRFRSERGTAGGVPGFYEPAGAWLVLNDSTVITAEGPAGLVRVWAVLPEGLRLNQSISTGLVPEAISSEDIDFAVEKARSELRRMAPGGQDYFGRDPEAWAPEYWSGIRAIVAESRDMVWIEVGGGAQAFRSTDGPGSQWYRLDLRTGERRELNLPRGFAPRRVHEDRVYGITKTEFDAHVVVVYRWN